MFDELTKEEVQACCLKKRKSWQKIKKQNVIKIKNAIYNEQDILNELDSDQSTFPGTPQVKRKRVVRKNAAARRTAKAPPQQDQITTPTHKGRLPF